MPLRLSIKRPSAKLDRNAVGTELSTSADNLHFLLRILQLHTTSAYFHFSIYTNVLILSLTQHNDIKIKLLSEQFIICDLENLHYQISREKIEPKPGFDPRISREPG